MTDLPEDLVRLLRRAARDDYDDEGVPAALQSEAGSILARLVPEYTREQMLEREVEELRSKLLAANEKAARATSEATRLAREVQRWTTQVNTMQVRMRQMRSTQQVIELPGGTERVVEAIRNVLELAGIDPAMVHIGERPLADDPQTGEANAPEVPSPATPAPARRAVRGRGARSRAADEPGGAPAGAAEPADGSAG